VRGRDMQTAYKQKLSAGGLKPRLFPVIHRTSAMVTLCSQVRTAVNAVACVVYFQPPAHARNMRLDGRGRWLLTDQVAEEQEESVPSQRREQHWVGWRMGRGYQ